MQKHQLLSKLNSDYENFRELRNYLDAIDAMAQILSIAPDWEHGEGWFELAQLYMCCEDYEAALRSCEIAQSYARGRLDFVLLPVTAEILTMLGKFDESITAFCSYLRAEVTDALLSQKVQLDDVQMRHIEELGALWRQRNYDLYQRLSDEMPEGRRFWESLKK